MMKNSNVIILVLLILLIAFGFTNLHAANIRSLTVGTAKIKITPEHKTPMSGYSSRTENFKGVHDDLFARVLVFDNGETRAALISAEIIEITFSHWKDIANRIQHETGIPRDNILLCATHTHCGPSLINSYKKELNEKLITAVKNAAANMKPARIGAGTGECKMNINRRGLTTDRDLMIGRNPDKPVDHEVGVIRIDDSAGDPIAVLINWGCHCTTIGSNNYQISGEWAGAASGYIERKFGNNVIAPVLIGTNGDINPLYANASFGEVKIIGKILSDEVNKVLWKIRTFSNSSIDVKNRILKLPGKKGSEILGYKESSNMFRMFGVNSFESAPDEELRLSILKIGNIIFAGVSGQAFTEIGLKFKRQSPYKFSFIVDHCNGRSGYIPTDDEYKEGGYEVLMSRIMPGKEKYIIDNLIEMVNEF